MLDKQLRSQMDIEQLRANQQAAALAAESQYRNKTADAAMLEAQARGGELQAKTDAIRKHTSQTPIQAFVNQYGGDIVANDPSMMADLGYSLDVPTATASELRELAIRKGLTPEVLDRASSYNPWNAYRRNDEPAEPFKDTGELIDDKMYGLPCWMLFGEGKDKFLERRKLQSNLQALRKAIIRER